MLGNGSTARHLAGRVDGLVKQNAALQRASRPRRSRADRSCTCRGCAPSRSSRCPLSRRRVRSREKSRRSSEPGARIFVASAGSGRCAASQLPYSPSDCSDRDVVRARVQQLRGRDGVVEAVLGAGRRRGRARPTVVVVTTGFVETDESETAETGRSCGLGAAAARGRAHSQRDQNPYPPLPHLTQSRKSRAKSTNRSLCHLRAIPRRSDSFDESPRRGLRRGMRVRCPRSCRSRRRRGPCR